MQTHIADIVNLIRWEELSDIVLCGHTELCDYRGSRPNCESDWRAGSPVSRHPTNC